MAITLAKREKYYVALAACLIALFLLFQFLISPFFEKRDRLRKGIIKQEQDLRELSVLIAEYYNLKQNSQDIDRVLSGRKRDFMLGSYVEKATRETQVDKYLKDLTRSSSEGSGPYEESMVETKLEGITGEQLVRYLYEIEDPDNLVFIKRISITDNKKEEGYLDSVIQVITFQQSS